MRHETSSPYRAPPPVSRRELALRAAALGGRTVAELACAIGLPLPADSRRGKGFVGQLVERALGADPCAGPRPDFSGLGIELKTVPVGSDGVPLGSTFCCSVELADAERAEWASSRLRLRLREVLWLPVVAPKRTPLPARRLVAGRLWRMDAAIEAELRADWEELMGRIGAGLGASLGAQRGRALQVRPKAANARVRVLGPGADGPERMLPLGFYLRREMVARLLQAAPSSAPSRRVSGASPPGPVPAV